MIFCSKIRRFPLMEMIFDTCKPDNNAVFYLLYPEFIVEGFMAFL